MDIYRRHHSLNIPHILYNQKIVIMCFKPVTIDASGLKLQFYQNNSDRHKNCDINLSTVSAPESWAVKGKGHPITGNRGPRRGVVV
jgi:hypothetical protein